MTAPATSSGGATVIDDRVRQRLIEHAVLSIRGVVRRGALAPGRALPSIAVGGGDASATINVEIATTWPLDGASVIDRVRSAVFQELSVALCERPERVDVQITHMDTDRTPAEVADAYAITPDDVPTADVMTKQPHAPRSAAGSTVAGVLLALGLVGVGCIAVRDALIAVGWMSGSAWIAPVLRWVGDGHWQWWTWSAAALAGCAGLALLVVAVKPRRRTHVAVGDGIWIPRRTASRWETGLATAVAVAPFRGNDQ